MQIMIDTDKATVPELRHASRFFTEVANLRDGTSASPFPLIPADETPDATSVAAPAIPAPPKLSIVTDVAGDDDAPEFVDASATLLPADALYDASGLPWDGRIHQASKATKKDGMFKLRKNIDPTVVSAVVQELRARKSLGQPVSPPPVETVTGVTVPPPPPPPPPAPLPMAPAVPMSPPATTAVPPPPFESATTAAVAPAAASASAQTYRGLMAKIVAATKAGTLSQEEVTAIVQKSGAPSIGALNSFAHLIPVVDEELDIAVLSKS